MLVIRAAYIWGLIFGGLVFSIISLDKILSRRDRLLGWIIYNQSFQAFCFAHDSLHP